MNKNNDIQQGTPEWLHKRKTALTGTTLKSLMGTPKARQEAVYEAIANRLTVGIDEEYENAMDRGIRLEPDGIASFEFTTGKSIERIGFCESDDIPAIAQSPDGYIKGDDTEAVEIKCMGGKNHVKMWLTNEIPDEYFWQAVQYFVVNDKLKKLYFCGYNPDIPIHPLHIIEINRTDIEEDVKKARDAQKVFLQEIEVILNTILKL